MFGQIIDRLDKWLNRAFLLSFFSPWLVFVFANVVMAYVTFPTAAAYIGRYVRGEPADKVIVIAVSLAAIAIAAYVTAPLVRTMTEILEGQYLPSWLAGVMTIGHADHLDHIDAQRTRLLEERSRLRELRGSYISLQRAKEAGERGRHNLNPSEITELEKIIAPLRAKRRRNQLIEGNELKDALRAVSVALEHNCADKSKLKEPASLADKDLSQKLHALHIEIVNKLLDYAIDVAEQKHAFARLERYKLFADAELAPTRLGNDAAALRSYCETRYNLDFDFFWTRLQIIFQKDEKLSGSLVNSKIQLDFAVLLCWLTALFTGFWLLILGGIGDSLITFLIVAGLGPLATMAWLGVVQESYSAFAELVRSAVDLKRLDLLKALHWPLPLTTNSEKVAWTAAGNLLILGSRVGVDRTFHHPTS